jgi:phosphoribosylanthranilate isomerase
MASSQTNRAVRVKICGVTSFQDALDATRAGVSLLGLNFYPPSPRSITPMQAERIVIGLREALGDSCPLIGGVFVNESPGDILHILEAVGLDFAQLSGDEPPGDVAALRGVAVKTIRPRSPDEAMRLAESYLPYAPEDEPLPALLLDAYHPDLYGGTGEQASGEIARAIRGMTPRLMLAGGLTPENVAARVAAIRPWGVDVASGVEGEPGRKDAAKMRSFVERVQSVGDERHED